MSSAKDFRDQSAVIPYRRHKNGMEVLLITSRDSGRWVLPKGHVEPDLTARESAAKEAYEEAGIEGVVAKRCVGVYRYAKTDGKGPDECRVEVYPMEVRNQLDDWPEKDCRRRAWMDVGEAARRVDEKKLGKLLLSFAGGVPVGSSRQ